MAKSLQSALRGRALTAEDAAYESARKVHNGRIDRHPAIIARCAGVADIMRALEFAQTQSLPLSIRCGGHSLAGFSVCDSGIMIDLEEMTAVTVDPETRTATAQGGANWGQFDHETQAFGLASTGGLVRTTGVAGLTLAGGHGFLMRKLGLACDNLIAAKVLTANGRLMKASAEENPDLLWALRGGGGNFGIVTELQYKLHEVGPVLGGLLIAPYGEASRILRFYDAYTRNAPDELGIVSVLATLPDGNKASVSLACYAGDLGAGEKVLHPLRTFTTPIADEIQPMPYTAVQSIVENFNPRGMRNYWKMVYTRDLRDDAIARLIDLYDRVPAPFSHIVVYTLGGAVSRIDGDATAVSYRDARHAVIAIGMWDHEADDERNIAWVREFASAMQPYAYGNGFYPNYEDAAGEDRLIATFGPEKYRRLASIKHKFDPTNVFRMNQNIRPAAP
jgi:FAD/FMN-containing dehydrogenase